MSRTRWILFTGAVVALLVLAAGPAWAGRRTGISASFFHGGDGAAHWSRAYSSPGDAFSMKLDVPDPSSYAGILLHHVTHSLPEEEPGFVFYETGTVSGGAPRLVIASGDGCYAIEYAYPETTDAWNTADQWDLMGSCGFAYNTGWSGVEATFTGKSVSAVYVVDDSYQEGHTSWIDELQYNGKIISKPSDNRRKH